ncbi:hypothetical protein GCM10027028_35300 [Streptomyces sundarbansensis]
MATTLPLNSDVMVIEVGTEVSGAEGEKDPLEVGQRAERPANPGLGPAENRW